MSDNEELKDILRASVRPVYIGDGKFREVGSEAAARIAELEAENDRQARLMKIMSDSGEKMALELRELEAEVKRLTLANERQFHAHDAAVLAEREACANLNVLIPEEVVYEKHVYREAIATYSAAIRARSAP